MFGRLLFSVVLLLTSVICLIDTINLNKIPAMVPRLYLVLLIVLTLIEISLLIKKQKVNLFDSKNWKKMQISNKVLMLLIILCVYVIAIQILGFYIATAGMIMICSYLLGSKNIFHGIISTAGLIGFIYFMFTFLLKMKLPGGIIDRCF